MPRKELAATWPLKCAEGGTNLVSSGPFSLVCPLNFSVVQFQLVERTPAVVVPGGAAVAAVDGYSEELVSVRYQAFIRKRTVVIGSCCCIRCTEGVQDLEVAVLPDAVKHTVAIRASGLGVRAESPVWPESQTASWARPVPILARR
jgi:hypothetical protein